MHISARFAMTDMLKACGTLNEFAQVAMDHSKQGLLLPIDEEERVLLERAMVLMRTSLDGLAPLVFSHRPGLSEAWELQQKPFAQSA